MDFISAAAHVEYINREKAFDSKRAAILDAELPREKGLDDILMERDPLRWILLAGQIHLEVLRRLKKEIQR